MSYVLIKNNLKKYGNDLNLWYHPFQGKTYELYLDTKKGYLVHRPELESNKSWLIKKSHAELLDGKIIE